MIFSEGRSGVIALSFEPLSHVSPVSPGGGHHQNPPKRETPMSDSRLKNYAVTAGGAAALAATGLAGADIQTSSGSTTIAVNQDASLFNIFGVSFHAINTQNGSWSTDGTASACFSAGTGEIAMVNSGVSIGTGFSGRSYLFNDVSFSDSQTTRNNGNLDLGSGVIVGFRLSASGLPFYGWVNYDLSMSEGEYTFTVNGWAYNDVAGEGIIAGENRAAGSSAVPGLGGLAALAIGAAGVRSRRQRTVA